MLEQFCNVTRHKIGGKAKAMIVTPSRLHAVRYLLEFKRQIREKGYTDLDVLVAFSGEVEDNGEPYTEEKLNKTKSGETIKEKALPQAFHTDEYGMLIVAEKYQTGFDEPLLHTMFVDKKLSGVKAVQTLSRLNRTMRGKQDTFVLDFVNSAEDIQKAFEPYYEETILEQETDPNVVYDLKNTLMITMSSNRWKLIALRKFFIPISNSQWVIPDGYIAFSSLHLIGLKHLNRNGRISSNQL